MRFVHSATLTLLLKGVGLIAGLGVSIVIARTLGPEGRGQYALVMTIIVLASTLGSFGLAASNTYFLAKDITRVRAIGFLSIWTGVIGTVISAVLLGLLYLFAPSALTGLDMPLLALTLLFIPVYLWGSIFGYAFLGRGDIVNFNLFETAQRVFFFVLAIGCLWAAAWTLTSYMWVVLVAISIMTIYLMTRYFADAPPGPLFDRSLIGPAWSYGMKSYIANLFTIAAMRIGILFVNHELGTEQAGLYSTAQQVMELLIIVPSVLGTVLFGRISDGKSNHLTGKLIRVVVIAYLPVIIGLSLFTDSIISLLFGHAFVAATTATRIMLPGSFLLGLEVILVNDLRGRGYPWNAVLVWIPISILSAIGYAVLIPKFGLDGAAIVTTVSYAAVFFYICICYRRMSSETLAQTFLPSIEDLKAVWQAARGASGIITEARLLRKEYARTPAADQDSTEIERSGAPR